MGGGAHSDLAGNGVMIGSIAHAKGFACGEHPTVPACLMIGLRESTAVSKVRARVLRGFDFCASTSRMRFDRSGGLHRRGGCLDSAGRLGRRSFSSRQSSSAAESISVAASFSGRCRLFRISPLCLGLLIYSNRDRRIEGGPAFGLARVGASGANWRKLGPGARWRVNHAGKFRITLSRTEAGVIVPNPLG